MSLLCATGADVLVEEGDNGGERMSTNYTVAVRLWPLVIPGFPYMLIRTMCNPYKCDLCVHIQIFSTVAGWVVLTYSDSAIDCTRFTDTDDDTVSTTIADTNSTRCTPRLCIRVAETSV